MSYGLYLLRMDGGAGAVACIALCDELPRILELAAELRDVLRWGSWAPMVTTDDVLSRRPVERWVQQQRDGGWLQLHVDELL